MDIEFSSLTIHGYSGKPVPNLFARQRGDASTLAVLLPGQGYTARMPLFYYAEQIALERGWDVLSVDYAYPPLAYDGDPAVRARRLDARKRYRADDEVARARVHSALRHACIHTTRTPPDDDARCAAMLVNVSPHLSREL